MSYAGSSPGISSTFDRSKSIETDTYSSYPAPPTLSSNQMGHSETQFSGTGQRSVTTDPVDDKSQGISDIRPPVNSSTEITDETGNRGWDPADDKAQSISDMGRTNKSGYGVDVSTGPKAPTQSDFAERERSNNGASDATESINPLDYAGISLVGKKFKLVNPEAYYVEKDDPLS